MRIAIIVAIILFSSTVVAMEKRGDMVTRVQPVTSPALTIQRTNATDAADGMVFDIKGDYQSQVVADAPTFYWKLDNDYVDTMGIATTGTTTTGVFASAKYGVASMQCILTNANCFVTVPYNASMEFGTTTDFTIEYWYNIASCPTTSLPRLVQHRTGNNGYYTGFVCSGSTYAHRAAVGINTITTASLFTVDSNWHHVAYIFTRSSGTLATYYDGIVTNTSGVLNGTGSSGSGIPLTIGASGSNSSFNGLIDEVAIYRRALTQAEVTKHYLNGTKSRMTFTNSGTISGVSVTVNGDIHSVHTLTANNIDTFGTTTSYSSFEPDGTLAFTGNSTVWNDINIPLAGAKVPAVNAPTWTPYSGNLNSYVFAVNDYADLSSSEIPHSYKQGTNLDIHTHIVTRSSDGASRTVKYVAYYSWGNPSTTMSSEASITGEATISASTPTFTHLHVDIGTISGATTSMGAMLKLRLKRIASSVAEPAIDPFVEQVGVHYEQDTVGSRQEVIK